MSVYSICCFENCEELAEINCPCSSQQLEMCTRHYGHHMLNNPNQNHRYEKILITLEETDIEAISGIIETFSDTISTKIQRLLSSKESMEESLLGNLKDIQSEYSRSIKTYLASQAKINAANMIVKKRAIQKSSTNELIRVIYDLIKTEKSLEEIKETLMQSVAEIDREIEAQNLLDYLKKENLELEKRVIYYEKENKNLKDTEKEMKENLRSRDKTIKDLRNRNDYQKIELDETTKNYEELSSKMNYSSYAIATLKEMLENSEIQLNEKEEKNRILENDIQMYQNELTNAVQMIIALKNEVSEEKDKDEKIAILSAKLKTAKENLILFQKHANYYSVQLSSLNCETQAKEKQIKELESSLEYYKHESLAHHENICFHIKKCDSEIKSYKNQADFQRDEIKWLRDQIEKFINLEEESEYNNEGNEIEYLQNQINRYEIHIRRFKDRLNARSPSFFSMGRQFIANYIGR